MAVIIPSASAPGVLPQGARANAQALNPGPAIERFGAAAFGAAAEIDRQNRATELREARVTAAEQLGSLRAEYDQTPDWSNLSERFERDTTAVGAELGKGLSPRSRGDFDLIWREMRAPHLASVNQREAALRRDHERGRLSTALDDLVARTAAAPDDASASALADQTADMILEAREAGWIDGEDEARLLSDSAGRTANALALRLLRENPAALLTRLDDGDFAAIGPEAVERYRTSADAALKREAELELTQADLAQREQMKALQAETGDALRLLDAGLTPQGLEDLRARATGTPFGRQLETTLRAQSEAGVLAVQPPHIQRRAIDIWRSANRAPGDEEVYAAMLRAHQATIESVDKDLLGHAAARGVVELPPLDLSDPATVERRVVKAESLADGWAAGAPTRYFTQQEVTGYAERIRTASPEDQLAFAAAIVDGFGARAPAALGELGLAEPTFGHAGTLLTLTGDDKAARAILGGKRLLDAGEGAKPKKALREAVIADLVAPATPGDDAMRARLLAAADAHFATTGAAIDPADEEALRDAYAASVQAASGGVMIDGALFGGVQPVNDLPVILPPELDARATERLLGAASVEDFAAASLGGAPVTADGKKLDRALGGAVLIYDGGGAYLVGRETPGGVALIGDETAPDGYFRLDLRKLAETVTPPPGLYQRATGWLRRQLGGAPAPAPDAEP